MGARRKPERKADVLAAMADYLLGAGVSDATLRPAAAALHTSPRMLLYHFGSKEELVVAALKEVRRRETEMLARALARGPRNSVPDVMRRVWRWYASPRRAPYLRLFFEAWGVSLQRPALYAGFLDSVRKDLLPLAEDALMKRGYSPREASAIATFMVAAMRGLLIDLVANRDRRRLDDAMEVFIEVSRMLAARGPTPAASTPAGRRARPSATAPERRQASRKRASRFSRKAATPSRKSAD